MLYINIDINILIQEGIMNKNDKVNKARESLEALSVDLHDLLESTIELYARVNQIRMYLFFAQEYGENNLQ